MVAVVSIIIGYNITWKAPMGPTEGDGYETLQIIVSALATTTLNVCIKQVPLSFKPI